jgi:hypothetical protein
MVTPSLTRIIILSRRFISTIGKVRALLKTTALAADSREESKKGLSSTFSHWVTPSSVSCTPAIRAFTYGVPLAASVKAKFSR